MTIAPRPIGVRFVGVAGVGLILLAPFLVWESISPFFRADLVTLGPSALAVVPRVTHPSDLALPGLYLAVAVICFLVHSGRLVRVAAPLLWAAVAVLLGLHLRDLFQIGAASSTRLNDRISALLALLLVTAIAIVLSLKQVRDWPGRTALG